MNKENFKNVSRETLHKMLGLTLEKYGVFVSEDFAKKAFEFWEELVFWNKTHNLTTVTDFYESALVHFADSLFPSSEKNIFFDGAKVLDLGTGGGFPGIPLALYFPKVDFHLLDKSRKKISFISLTAAKLGIENVTGINENFFSISDKYDIVVSRAVRIDEEIFEHCRKIINPNGHLVVFYSSQQTPFEDKSLEYTKSYVFEKGKRVIAFYRF
jgi:16S rRNA (guanine(527)-N(7))-methyltransferase GidB